MRHTNYFVYRSADNDDCSAEGLSSKVTRAKMFFQCSREEAIEYCKDNNIDPALCFFLKERTLWNEDHSFAEPLIKPRGSQMFGGNFLYTSDCSGYTFKGEKCHRPIPIHDRFEIDPDYQ